MPLVRSISGLRATVGDALTPALVARYAVAFARLSGGGTIIVGRDGRPSGGWIEDVVSGALRAAGATPLVIGMAPTPTVQMAVEHSDATGGISITASHNPSEWNGLKFLDGTGVFLDAAGCEELFALVDADDDRALASWERVGERITGEGVVNDHVERTLALPFVDLAALHRRAFHVVVDAVNASGSHAVPALLERMGCRVVPLHCNGTGYFPHTPEPLPENLGSLRAAVREHGADLGIAVDPDADRLVLIDERGEPIGEEYTIVQCTDFVLRHARLQDTRRDLACCVNLSTTRAVEDVAARHGAVVHRSAVGEINVVGKMKETGAVIGGEGSGGVILPALHYGRDALAGIAITMQNLLESGSSLSALRSALPHYTMVKRKQTVSPSLDIEAALREVIGGAPAAARINTVDGVRIDLERSWVHLRRSNTEPIVRAIAEAPTVEEATVLADTTLQHLAR